MQRLYINWLILEKGVFELDSLSYLDFVPLYRQAIEIISQDY